MAFSIIISEKGGGERRQLFDQAEVSIGRVQGNDLVLPKGNVSKRHCRLEFLDGRFVVTDYGSTNGTYLNRRRISQSTIVRQGDRIYIGDFILRIEEGGEAGVDVVSSPPVYEIGIAVPTPASTEAVSSSDSPPPMGLRAPAVPGRPSLPGGPTVVPPVPSVPPAVPSVPPVPAQPTATPVASSAIDVVSNPSPRAEHDEARQAQVAAVRFLVERVLGQVSPAELRAPAGVRRIEGLIEAARVELEAQGFGQAPGELIPWTQMARAELLELGPLGPLLQDPDVVEIAASGVGQLTVVRGVGIESVFPFCAPGSLERAIERVCADAGSPLNPAERLARRQLGALGFVLDVVRGDLSPNGAVVRLRRRSPATSTLDDLVRLGTISRSMANLLQQCVQCRANLLIVGPARSGAGDVLAALASSVSGERILSFSDDEPIADAGGRVMNLLEARSGDLASVLSTVAELPAHRILVDGLLRGDRASSVFRAAAEGADGIIARLKAHSIERGLSQLVSQVAMGHAGLSVVTVAEAVAATFDLVLEVARLPDGRSRVMRVSEIVRAESPLLVAHDVFGFVVERLAGGGTVEGSFKATGRRPQFTSELQLRGVRVDSGMFGRAARPPYPSS